MAPIGNPSASGLLAPDRVSVPGEPEGWLMKRAGLLLATPRCCRPVLRHSLPARLPNGYVCGGWSTTRGPLCRQPSQARQAAASTAAARRCADLLLAKSGLGAVPNGQGASWTATAPPGLTITHIYTVNDTSSGVGDGQGWWGEFFWEGGPGLTGQERADDGQLSASLGAARRRSTTAPSGGSSAAHGPHAVTRSDLDVGGVDLTVSEIVGSVAGGTLGAVAGAGLGPW